MRLFVIKTVLITLGFFVFLAVAYTAANYILNAKSAENTVFLWGDSQTYHGLDLKVLSRESGMKVQSAARPGAGMYDLLQFARNVPTGATVVVAVSTPALLRKGDRELNRNGFSVGSLLSLAENGYPWPEVYAIASRNVRPALVFQTSSTLFKYADTITYRQPLEYFQEAFKEVPEYLTGKERLYLEGIRLLREKNCRINLITFPYQEILATIEAASPVKPLTDDFLNEIIGFAGTAPPDTLLLPTGKEVMHDLTHLNAYGAEQVSRFVAEGITKEQGQTFCVVIPE